MRWLGVAFVGIALSGCADVPSAARSFDDPAVQKLYALSVAEYYANLRLASDIANSCDRYTFDQSLDLDINERRSAEGRGSISALRQRNSIDAMSDIRTREFRAKYGVAPGEGDVCDAADQEVAQQTALSAVLVPSG